MPLKLVKRGKSDNWYIRGSVRGVLVDESTGLGDRKAAEEVLALRSAEIVRQSIHGHSAVRTFADAALSYMEAGGERTHLTPIIKHFARKKLSVIGQHEIEEAAAKLKPGASPATLNRHIYTPIAAVLNHAARKKWCDKPVIARPSQPAGRVRWITPAEAERLVEAAAPHLRPLVVFLLCTGARISEALYLDWRDVDLERRQVQFLNRSAGGYGTKSDDNRGVPLHPRAVAALSALPHRKGAVFRRPAKAGISNATPTAKNPGVPYEDREGAGGGQVKTAWAGMLRRAGITNFTPHDCRHTWATWHYMANRDLSALMALGGWKSPDMVMRYAHVNVGHLSGSIDAMWELPSVAPAQDREAG